jgi:hypothetical protein
MTEHVPEHGRVEFHQPPVKLVADLPSDEEMREHLDEWMENDGHPGSCTILNDRSK